MLSFNYTGVIDVRSTLLSVGKVTLLIHINSSRCLISPVINCTSLTVTPGGPLRMSSCGNHYGSICNFSCSTGYRMNGSATVMCNAGSNRLPGFWDDPPPKCQGTVPLNAKIILAFVFVFTLKAKIGARGYIQNKTYYEIIP